MGIVMITVPCPFCFLRFSAILVMNRDFPIPARVDDTTLTHDLIEKQTKMYCDVAYTTDEEPMPTPLTIHH